MPLLVLLISACDPGPSEPSPVPPVTEPEPVRPPTLADPLLSPPSDPEPPKSAPRSSASMDPDTVEAAILAGVKKSSGRIMACVEPALMRDATVNGRVSVGWTVTAGVVGNVHLVRNTTGDDALATCIQRAVRAFRFDPGLSAKIKEYPWVISG